MRAAPERADPGPTRGFALASLRHRLLLLVLLAVLPALALLVSTTWEQRRQAARDAKEAALRLARLASGEHERLVEGARSLLVGLAQLSDVQMHNERACSALFAEVQRRFPLYEDIGAVRPDGHVFCTARRPRGRRNAADRPYFRQAIESGEFAVTDYRTDAGTGEPRLTVAYPALDRAGATWAVVFATLDLRWVSHVAMRAALPPGSVVNVLDAASGVVLARSAGADFSVGRMAPEPSVLEAVRRGPGEGTLEATGVDGTDRLYAFTALAGLPTPRSLFVVVGIPRQAALADADRLLLRNLAWAGLAIVVIAIAAALASDLFILRRVARVVEAARRLSAGDLSARAHVRGSDEIGLMAHVFNGMARHLQERVTNEEEARKQLAARVGELDLLNQMAELLQSCFTLEEAHQAIARLGPRLFPGESAAVLALDPDRHILEAVASWGPDPLDRTLFPADGCLALVAGRAHVVSDASSAPVCQHVPARRPASYACTLLSAQDKALGVLYLASPVGAPPLGPAALRLAEAVARQLALALTNVQLREDLRVQSIRDPLTGLFNRRYMEEALGRELNRARRSGRPMSLLMIDVDRFKEQNDRFGHEGGDAVLHELGRMLKANLRKEDIPCRYGGEEFALLLPEAALDGAARRAEQLRELVSRLPIPYRDGVIGPVTVSIGVAAFPEHGDDVRALVQAADAALYQAKREGRNRVSVASLHSAV